MAPKKVENLTFFETYGDHLVTIPVMEQRALASWPLWSIGGRPWGAPTPIHPPPPPLYL